MESWSTRQNWSRPSKIFVGSLPGDASETEVYDYFGVFGKIKRVVMFYKDRRLSHLTINRGFCHVEVADQFTAKAILSYRAHIFKGRRITCDPYIKGEDLRKKNQQNDNTRVMLKKIPACLTDADLIEALKRFGQVKSAYILQRQTSANQTLLEFDSSATEYTGSAQFRSVEEAEACIKCSQISIKGFTVMTERYVHNYKRSGKNHKANLKCDSHSLGHLSTPLLFNKPILSVPEQNMGSTKDLVLKTNFEKVDQVPGFSLQVLDMRDLLPQVHIKPTSKLFTRIPFENNHSLGANILFRAKRRLAS